ncbi:MAG: [FeFe] hydrogenase H-cluster radical SAM maturase HydE [Eubacterium sp.]|nr:[FeFe] hydrogenase H-cluster radical SAM maturase HydE [Eubacterium sp.]
MNFLLDKLEAQRRLTHAEWTALIQGRTPELAEDLFSRARRIRDTHYGKGIFIRGLIEFTNICKNDCLYCGIRRSNKKVTRYRLAEDEILACCDVGYSLGFRTFVLQGGEDPYFTDDRLTALVKAIKGRYPDCALTLSVGERSPEAYRRFYDAGADRYLLRHETANPEHYARLHPPELTLEHRQNCLRSLKAIGYQTGTGFMVGSPYQTPEDLARDMVFIQELNPQMVGIGPFIPHCDTPFAKEPAGTLELTLFMLGLLRLLLPKALLPATTALGSITPEGRALGIQAGANVIMPNLSPPDHRKDYALYNGKLSSGEEAAEGKRLLADQMAAIGHHLVTDRGDSKNM